MTLNYGGKQLWCAVIEQALIDATNPLSKRFGVRMDQLRSREWLTVPNDDFHEVCALAGMEPDRIRTKATELINKAKQRDREFKPQARRARRQRNRGVGQRVLERASDRINSSTQETTELEIS